MESKFYKLFEFKWFYICIYMIQLIVIEAHNLHMYLLS